MANNLTDEEKDLQQKLFSTNTDKNDNMNYSRIDVINKGLDPEFLSGNKSRMVNAINYAVSETNLNKKFNQNTYNKFANLIIDPNTVYGASRVREMQNKLDPTVVESICTLYDIISKPGISGIEYYEEDNT